MSAWVGSIPIRFRHEAPANSVRGGLVAYRTAEPYGCVRFTTVTVNDDGYSAEWWITLCATTGLSSS